MAFILLNVVYPEGKEINMAGSPRRRPGAVGEEVAATLRAQLARQQDSQRALSARCGVSSTQLNQYFRGLKSPTIEEFVDICDGMNLRAEKVLELAIRRTENWRPDDEGLSK